MGYVIFHEIKESAKDKENSKKDPTVQNSSWDNSTKVLYKSKSIVLIVSGTDISCQK